MIKILPVSNLLPETSAQKDFKKYYKAIRNLSLILIVSILGIFVEAGIIGLNYLSQSDHDVINQQKYTEAMQNYDKFQKQVEIYKLAEKENLYLLNAVQDLIVCKPESIKFTMLQISGGNDGILIEGVVNDPKHVMNYINAINSHRDFCDAKLQRLGSSVHSDDFKSFSLRAKLK